MSDNALGISYIFSPNQLGDSFVMPSGGGGNTDISGISTYTISMGGDNIFLSPVIGEPPTSQVAVGSATSVATLTNKTTNMSYNSGTGLTTIANNLSLGNKFLTGVTSVVLGNNAVTTVGTGATATMAVNGVAQNTNVATWANFNAGNNVVINPPYKLQVNPNNSNAGFPLYTYVESVINTNLTVGQPSLIPNNAPNVSIYPTDFTVGQGVLPGEAPARTIGLYSGVGGTTIASIQGVAIDADVDVNINSPIITLDGAEVNITSGLLTIEALETNYVGNISVEGGLEVIGLLDVNGTLDVLGTTVLGGAVAMGGLATVAGALTVEGLTALVGGCDITGATLITGALTQVGDIEQTAGNFEQAIGGYIGTSKIQDLFDGTDHTGLSIAPLGTLELINLSSINGVAYVAGGGGGGSDWSLYPSQQNVDVANFDLTNVHIVSAPTGGGSITVSSDTGTTSIVGGLVTITGNNSVSIGSDKALNIYASTFIYDNLALVGSTITGVSTINGVPYAPGGGSGNNWWTYTAGTDVNMGNNALTSVKNINFPTGSNMTISGGNQASFITMNDSDLVATDTIPTMLLQTHSQISGADAIYMSTTTVTITGVTETNGLICYDNCAVYGTLVLTGSLAKLQFNDGSVQSSAINVDSYLGINDTEYAPNENIIWTNTAFTPTTNFRTATAPVFYWSPSVSGSANIDTFSPATTGIYRVELNVGAGTYCASRDSFQTDLLYSLSPMLLNATTATTISYLLGFTKYQILAGSIDSVRQLAPTVGSVTCVLTATQKYVIQMSPFYSSGTPYIVVKSPSITFTYLGASA